MAAPLHLHRHRGRDDLPVAVDDAVAAATRPAVPGDRQRRRRRDRVRQGVFAVWLVRFMRSRPTSPPAPRWAWPILVAAGLIGLVLGVVYFRYWQGPCSGADGVPQLKWYNHFQAGVLAVILLFLFVEVGQLIGRLARFLVRQLERIAPPRVSAVVAVFLLLSVGIAILNGVVVRGSK